MRFLEEMGTALIKGPSSERMQAAITLASWFAMGAFISSVLAYYAPLLTPTDTSQTIASVAGGVVAAALSKIV